MASLPFHLLPLISAAFLYSSISAASSIPPYSDHCSAVVPPSPPTNPTYKDDLPSLSTSYFTGGDRLLGLRNNHSFYYSGKSLSLRFRSSCHETAVSGVYKVDGLLYVRSPYAADYGNAPSNFTFAGSYNYRRRRSRGAVRFTLTGFWSESKRTACLVGSASLKLGDGGTLDFSGVVKLQFAAENPTLRTAVTSGTFQSTLPKGDPGYFDPISIFSYPHFPNYNYTLLLEDSGTFPRRPLRPEGFQFCNILSWKSFSFDLDYSAANCTDPRRCSPLATTAVPESLLLMPIQCSNEDKKITTRYIATFQNITHNDQSFSFSSTLIAEGLWDENGGRMFIEACRILDPIHHFGESESVGDCGIRMNLRYPAAWTIRHDLGIYGELWSIKNIDKKGNFNRINLTLVNNDMVDMVGVLGLKYEYTELKRVQDSCPVAKQGSKKRKGKTYPDERSLDMRFDMSVGNSKGEPTAWGNAMPLFVEDEMYSFGVAIALAPASSVAVSDMEIIDRATTVFNISYKIVIPSYFDYNSSKWISVLNTSLDRHPQVEITAEGVYRSDTGELCMIGCRKLKNESTDCEILVKFEFPPVNAGRDERVIKGTIASTRSKGDPLRFDELKLSGSAYYTEASEAAVWRIDIEITLVLISNTLFCIFIGLQIFHTKRHPEAVEAISLVMVAILALGHMIPLVLNVEAIFFEGHSRQTVFLSSGGWVEANEVAVRVITLVAFLLQIRLLQLVWAAKRDSGGEKKASLITLPIYIAGALITVVVNLTRTQYGGNRTYGPHGYRNYSVWGGLRSYAGLILDGFLLPQVAMNAARGSTEKALSHPFYMGTSAVRLVPHAYNRYRAWSYPAPFVNGTYYYANPAGDFYSTAWDVVIPVVVAAMAAAVFLQQRRGGRCILPKRFREVELYAKVPTAENQ
ncbi:uncharacterized protein LOC127254446 [Andrographis paniculata]|uniref:uncharacterized protein LOC127254446 n=1 Tax=Andrographis paniculata TaxID=175694 RepID=UPI0021E9195D|nr:uncharacterized protein LOC127254446 [Andrographis paniculata]